jgi:hypothetical protein
MLWFRTCQECGNEQRDIEPKDHSNPTTAYCNRKCKKCKSEALDLGSDRPTTPEEIQAQKDFLENWE